MGTGGTINALVTVQNPVGIAGHFLIESMCWLFIFTPYQNGLDQVILVKVIFLASDEQLALWRGTSYLQNWVLAE